MNSKKKLRIGINGRFLTAKRTGVQRTAYDLIQSILKLDTKNKYFLFTNKKGILVFRFVRSYLFNCILP